MFLCIRIAKSTTDPITRTVQVDGFGCQMSLQLSEVFYKFKESIGHFPHTTTVTIILQNEWLQLQIQGHQTVLAD